MVESLEKYKKVRSDREAVPDGIIRVNRTIQARNFIDHVLDEFNNKGKDKVTLSSLGQAITKAVTIAEIVKHRIAGLHQVNEINTIVIDDEYEPLEEEEGLDKMTVSRKLTCLQITLSKTAPADVKVAGYQEPIPDSEVNPDAGPEDESRKQDGRRNRRRAKSATKKDTTEPATGAAASAAAADSGAAADAGDAKAGDKEKSGQNNRRRNNNRRGGGGNGGAGGQKAQRPRTAKADGATPEDSSNPFLPKTTETPAGGKPAGGQQKQKQNRDGANKDGGNRGGGRRGGGGRGDKRGGAAGAAGAGAASAAAATDAKPTPK